jgi:hypothetical protein
VTSEVSALGRAAREKSDAAVLPSGAGGGDIVLVVSREPLGTTIGKPFGFAPLSLRLGVRGVHADRAVILAPRENEVAP